MTIEGSDKYYCKVGTALCAIVPLLVKDSITKTTLTISGGDNVLVLAARYNRAYSQGRIVLKLNLLWGTKVVTIILDRNSYEYRGKKRVAMWDFFKLIRSTRNE